MSLEQALIENTATLRELIAVMKGAQVAAPVVVEETAAIEETKPAKKSKPEKAETPKQEVAATPEPKGEVAPAADEAPAATYQDAATAITALSKAKGRDAAVALLKKFGASKLPEVKPEDFAAIVADANAQVGA